MEKDQMVWALVSNETETKIIHGLNEDIYNKKLFVWNSLSARFATKEELIAYEGILEKPCVECGGLVKSSWIEPTKARVIETNTCFNCLIWLDWIPKKDNPSIVRIKGSHYWIEPDKPKNTSFLGFGGAAFRIKFNDGRIITTHNLWHQGTIPERFRERLPDNAVFIKE
jgi:hypothetical protein